MKKEKQIEFIDYIMESIKLELTVAINSGICENQDSDILIDSIIKKLIEKRMKKQDPHEILTITCF